MLNKKDGPYYKQIAELIKLQIEKGNLRPGEKLPSERELKEQYKVGRIIIRMALDILLKENLIEKKIGVGTFINRNLKIKIKRNVLSEINLMTVVYKRDPYFEELLNAKKIGSIEAFNKVINSKLGLGKIPQFLQDVIIQILESRPAITTPAPPIQSSPVCVSP